jgi:hypothetical protein
MTASERTGDDNGRIYVDARLWEAWDSLPFLVGEQRAVVRFEPDDAPSFRPADEMLLLLWPYDNLEPYLGALPHPARIEARSGPLTRGDLEETAYPAYALYLVEPLEQEPPTPLARFGDSIELIDATVETEGRTWNVHLAWRARDRPEETYTAFVYVCDDDCERGGLLGQHDAPPGGGYYPTHVWHPGDVIVDVHSVELPPGAPVASSIAVGLYAWPRIERLPVTQRSGSGPDDMLVLSTDTLEARETGTR